MRRAERWLPWIYSLPMIGFVGLIFAYPMLSLLKFSVEHVGRSVYLPTRFVGAANFQFIFTDSLFLGAIANNLKLFLCVPVLLVLSVLLAQILHDRPRRLPRRPEVAVHQVPQVDQELHGQGVIEAKARTQRSNRLGCRRRADLECGLNCLGKQPGGGCGERPASR